ncbi:MAG: hypothetical protein RLZZ28_245, partial [Bacteroidota bacterium]
MNLEEVCKMYQSITDSTIPSMAMSRKFKYLVRHAFFTLSLLFNVLYAIAQPTLSSFSPTSGIIGTTVNISGTGFNTTTTNNIVFFGATRATVSAASANSLTVTVPAGATNRLITVLNTGTGLSAVSSKPFLVTFAGATISLTSLASNVNYTATTNPFSTAIADLDGDGKADIIVGSNSTTISIYRNTGTAGSITAASFSAKLDLTAGNATERAIAVGDVDGDGKPDLVTTNYNDNNISVFKNTSTSGNISFASKVDFDAGILSYLYGIAIGDLDGDGKPDIVVSQGGTANVVSVYRNTATTGSISSSSFAAKSVLSSSISNPKSVVLRDVDGDGKLDIITANNNLSGTVTILRNTSSSGSISVAAKVDLSAASYPFSLAVDDLDGDGKPDIAVGNDNSSGPVSIFRNTSSSGSVSFASKVDFTSGNRALSIDIGDIDGDGKPDMAVGNYGSNTLSVFKNTATSGSITSGSFAAKVDYTTASGPEAVAIGDLDGDNVNDIAVANWTAGSVSVFRNIAIPTISVTGTLSSFSTCSGTASVFQSIAVSGSSLSGDISITAPSGYEISTTSGSGYANTITLTRGSNLIVSNTTVYARITNIATGSPTGNISISSSGATTQNLTVTGTVNALPTISGTLSVCVGSTTSLTGSATAAVSNAWVSSNSSVATVSSIGLVSGIAAGTVTITYTNTNGCSQTASVTVNALPTTPVATNGGNICAGLTLTLNGSTIAGATYAWTGPNSFSSFLQNPAINNVTTAASGTYSLTVNVNGCQSAVGTTTVIISPTVPAPTVSVGGSTSFCSGGNVVLSSSSSTGNQWYKDGVVIGAAINQSYTATSSGSYTVVVTGAGNCTVESAATIVTVAGFPIATITSSFGLVLGSGGTVKLTGNTGLGYSYQWYRNAVLLSGQTGNEITATQTGSYTLQVTNGPGCSTVSSPAQITAIPSVSVSGATTFCSGGSVNITVSIGPGQTFVRWKDGNNNTVGFNNTTFTANTTGSYAAEINTGSVQSTQSVVVTVNPLPIVVISSNIVPASVCSGQNVILSGSGANSYQWIQDNNIIGGATTATYSTGTQGVYTVKGT